MVFLVNATLVNIIIPCKFYLFKSKLFLVFSFVSIYFLSYFLSLAIYYPSFMQSIFSSRTSKHPSRNPNNLNHFRPNQVKFGSKSLKAIGPQIWNCLPSEIKSADNLNSFKRMIKQWDGLSCKCNACKYNHTL